MQAALEVDVSGVVGTSVELAPFVTIWHTFGVVVE
jgi:hypothetical protein